MKTIFTLFTKKIFKHAIFCTTILFCGSAMHAQNRSMNFEGTDDYVDIGNNAVLTPSSFTIEAYVKFNALPTLHSPIISKYDTYSGNATFSLSQLADGKIELGVYHSFNSGTYAITNTALSLNSWYHVAATFDMSTKAMKIYLNGSEVTASVVNFGSNYNSLQSNNTSVKIGSMRTQEGTNRYLNGNIDEIRFWNYVRTATEIQNNYNTELTGTENGLICYYKMDLDNENCGVWDCSNNKLHGTRNGTSGTNNLPQYSTDVPTLTDVACGVSNLCPTMATVDENSNQNKLAYPNPFHEILNLPMLEKGVVSFYDATGKLLKTQILHKGKNEISGQDFSSGVYFYQVKNPNGEILYSGKVVKR